MDPFRGTIEPVWRTFAVLLSAVAVIALVAVAAASGRGGNPAPRAVLAAEPVPEQGPVAGSVPSADGAVLDEMVREMGTPRRVSRSAARLERRIRRIEARIAARQEAARRRAAAAAAARARARTAAIGGTAPYWFDAEAAAQINRAPTSPQEAEWLNSGRGGWVGSNGLARAPVNAPPSIKRIIAAGNLIARSPYKWGGGHGAWRDKGYDCSGSVSYALAAGGLLGWSQTSGQLMNWGAPGKGRWLTIYAHEGHVFMYVAGLRFDTSGRAGDHSSRWQLAPRSAAGFVARHYPGL
jgi:cell wall-associated NlpC family hydrolase